MLPSDSFPLVLPSLLERPRVSVLIASYNYAAYLPRALDSLMAQSYPHFEAVICDDGSTDDSRAIASHYARRDARFRLLAKENGGVASALNAAFAASTGSILCLLDADDFFAPTKLARVGACFQARPAAGFVLHAMQQVDSREEPLGRLPRAETVEEGWFAEQVVARGGRWRSLPTSALSFRREVADRLFPIPETTFRSEADGFLTMLAPLITQVAFLPEVLAGYRLHGANLTGSSSLDRTTVHRRLDALDRQQRAVNDRLDAWNRPGWRLRLEDHLNYREMLLLEALFDGAPRRVLVRMFAELAPMLLADAVYGIPRKVLGLAALGGAILLPVSARPAWIEALLSRGGLRRVLRA